MSAIEVNIKELQQYRYQANGLLTNRTKASAHLAGGHLSRIKGRGMEFSECRRYQPGDDIRCIDWRVTARTGKTHTKLFSEEKERPVFVLLDLSPSMYFGSQFRLKSVQACHLTALLAWATRQKSDRVGGIIIGDFGHKELKPQRQQRGIMQLLNQTTTLHNARLSDEKTQYSNEAETLAQGLARLRLLCKAGSHIMLISDFLNFDTQAQQQLAQLKRHNEVEAWQIFDPLEIALPTLSGNITLPVSDGKQHGFINPGNARSREQYKRKAELKQQALQKVMRRYGIRHHTISSGESLTAQMNGKP